MTDSELKEAIAEGLAEAAAWNKHRENQRRPAPETTAP
jgi:hypothetical protein